MAIVVHNRNDSAKGAAAENLENIFKAHLAGIDEPKNEGLRLSLLSNVQCYGQRTQAIDLGLLMFDQRKRPRFTPPEGQGAEDFKVRVAC